MSSIWSTASQPPGASTTSPTPLQGEDEDDDFAYDFATIGGSPVAQTDPDTSGESFHYIPSVASSSEKEIARDRRGEGVGGSVANRGRDEKGMHGLGLMLPMPPSGEEAVFARDPSIVYATRPHPPRPPVAIAERSPPIAIARPAPPPSKPPSSLYSRWADPDYVPEPPTVPMKLFKAPSPSSAHKPPPLLDASAPSFAPPVRTAPSPIPIRPPQTATQLSIAEKFRARIPPGVASSMPSYHAPTPPPPPSPATTRSSSTAPGLSEVEPSGGVGMGVLESAELRLAREALSHAEQKLIKLEEERTDLLAQLKEAAEVAMREGDQADAERRGLEELVISLRERCAELEASETALEEERDDLKGRLEEAVREIVDREDGPNSPETLLKQQDDLQRRLTDTKEQLQTAEHESKRAMDLCTHLQDELDAARAHQQVVSTRSMEAKEESRKLLARAKEDRDVALARLRELEGEELTVADLRRKLEEEQEHRLRERIEWSGEVKELEREKEELSARLDAALSRQSSNASHPRRYSVQDLLDLARSPLSNVAPDLRNAPPEMRTPYAQFDSNGNSAGGHSSASSSPRSHQLSRRPSIPSYTPPKSDRDSRTISSLRREIDNLKLGAQRIQTEKEAAEFDVRKEAEKKEALVRKSQELEKSVAEQGVWMEELLAAVQGLEVENVSLKARLEGGGIAAPLGVAAAPPAPAPHSSSDDSHSSGFVTPSGSPIYSAAVSPRFWASSSTPSTHPEAPPPPASSVLARDPTPPLSLHDPLRPGSVPIVQVGEPVDVGPEQGGVERGRGRREAELKTLEKAFGDKGGMTDQTQVEKELEKVEKEFAAEGGYQGGGGEGGAHGREWSTLTTGSTLDSMKGLSEPGDIDQIMGKGEGSSTLPSSPRSPPSEYDESYTLPPLPGSAIPWDAPHLTSTSSSAMMDAPSTTYPTSPRYESASSTTSRTSGRHSRGSEVRRAEDGSRAAAA